jgi:hypothetical protein
MTLLTPLTLSPPPVIPEPDPTPMIVLLAATRCMPLIAIMPLTRTTAGELDCIALISVADVVTVTGEALPPPVVPVPKPVGLPTADAWPAAATVSAAAAATTLAPAHHRRAVELRMMRSPFCRGSSLIPHIHGRKELMDYRERLVDFAGQRW